MPRIDPSQLLQTLSVLLAPNGGIKSAGEVPRIVQLMQKFSKKLVSKCIYIHILCASTPELLELFLTQKGWDLLNAWFTDAFANQNYFLCSDLIKLFALCPMTSTRLKENVEINQAPKLIRQLSSDPNISPDVRTAALQVLQKWMSVIRSPQVNGAQSPSKEPVKTGSKRPLSSKYDDGQFVAGGDGSESENEAQLDFDDSKDYNPNEDSDGDSDKGKRKKFKKDDSVDVDDLLASTETSEDDDDEEDALTKFYKKRSEQKKKEEERRKEKTKVDDRKSKSYSKTEIRDKLQTPEKEKIKEVAKKLKEETKTSSTSLISSLGRIPKFSKPDAEKKSNGPSFGDMLGDLDTMKPKPKAAPFKNKNKDLLDAFTDQSPNKPKSKSDSKSSSSDRHKSDKDRDKDKERSRDKDRDRESHKSKDRDKERSRDKDKERSRDKDKERSKDKDRDKERRKEKDRKRERRESESRSSDEKSSDKPKPKLVLPEKRSHKDSSLPSPKDEAKKSPRVVKESNFLGDILGDIMKEPPKKKKRRPSDVKITENNLKELAEKAKSEEEAKAKSPEKDEKKEMTPEEETKVENSDEMEFKEPTSDLPREVRGILVFVKGRKEKKKLMWKEEKDLVSIEYFELDETERCNVFKEKSFEEMKKKEAMFEKSKFGTGFLNNEEAEDKKQWKLIPIVFEGDDIELAERLKDTYGKESKEKRVQEIRELRVLKALQFNQTPKDPSEPDPGSNDKLGIQMKEIPIDDLSDNKEDSSYNYSINNWPTPSGFFPSSTPTTTSSSSIPTNINALLSNINTNLLSSLPPVSSSVPGPDLSKPPPMMTPSLSPEEAQLLATQKAAAAALGLGVNNQSYPPSNGNGNNYNNGYNNRPRGGHVGHNRGHYNNDRGYSKGYRDNYRDDRGGGHNNKGYRDNYREGGHGGHNNRRPCKFWMDRGHCKEEDRCLYPHPSR